MGDVFEFNGGDAVGVERRLFGLHESCRAKRREVPAGVSKVAGQAAEMEDVVEVT